MKKAISTWAFPKGTPLEEQANQTRRAGFDGIELALDEQGGVSLASTDADLLAVRRMVQDEGLELFSLATGLYWRYPLTSNDRQTAQKSMDIARRQIEAAGLLGCDTILLVPGAVTGEVSYDVAYERAKEALKALAPLAQQAKVRIGVENVWNKFLLSPLEFARFLEEIHSPWVGAYFDVGNVVINGYPEQWIRILKAHLCKIHFKDFKAKVGTIDGFVSLLDGDVNYPAVMRALREAGYDGWVTAEVSAYRYCPEETLRHSALAMDTIFQMR